MHTPKKHSRYTSPAKKRRKTISQAKSRRLCQLCTKCVLCTSVFTLALLVPSEWNLSKPLTGFWEHAAKKDSVLPADAKITGQAPYTADSAQDADDPHTAKKSVPAGSSSSASDADSPSSSDNTASDSQKPSSNTAGSVNENPVPSPDYADSQAQTGSSDADDPAAAGDPQANRKFQYGEYDMQKPEQTTNTDEQTIYTDGYTTNEKIYYSYADGQPQFSAAADGQIQAVPERLPTEQLLDTTVDDAEAEHFTQLSGEWNLILVNPWNPLPEDYRISLTSLPNGHSIDSRCYPALTEMMNACREAGFQPLICSSYRSQEKQETLFQERMDELLAQGYTKKEAKAKAGTSVARPGTSEHQAGLAVDLVDNHHQVLDTTQQDTPVQQWLMENSWKYGFILRYPENKSKLTGIIYEPWHYRYVGKDAAKEIYERGLCLEEYLEELS